MAKEIQTSIEIKAEAKTIWKTFTDFKNYQNWNPFIKELEGEISEGQHFSVKIHPPKGTVMIFNPKLLLYQANKELRWKGKLLFKGLFDGEHYFQIQELEKGRCLFVQGEIFNGMLVPLFGKQFYKKVENGFNLMNQALKEKVEILKEVESKVVLE